MRTPVALVATFVCASMLPSRLMNSHDSHVHRRARLRRCLRPVAHLLSSFEPDTRDTLTVHHRGIVHPIMNAIATHVAAVAIQVRENMARQRQTSDIAK